MWFLLVVSHQERGQARPRPAAVSMARTRKSLLRISYRDTLPYLHQKHLGARRDTAIGLASRPRAFARKNGTRFKQEMAAKKKKEKQKGQREKTAACATATDPRSLRLCHFVLSRCSLIINATATFWLFDCCMSPTAYACVCTIA